MRDADQEKGTHAGMLLEVVANFEATWGQFTSAANLTPQSMPWFAARQVPMRTAHVLEALRRGELTDAGVTALYHAMQVVLLSAFAQDINGQIERHLAVETEQEKVEQTAKRQADANRANGGLGGRPAIHSADRIGAAFMEWRSRHPNPKLWSDDRILDEMKKNDASITASTRHMRELLRPLGVLQPSRRKGKGSPADATGVTSDATPHSSGKGSV